jgi:hypothetical protein
MRGNDSPYTRPCCVLRKRLSFYIICVNVVELGEERKTRIELCVRVSGYGV